MMELLRIQKAFLHLLSFSLRLSKDCELSTCLCLGKGYVIKYSYQIPLWLDLLSLQQNRQLLPWFSQEKAVR